MLNNIEARQTNINATITGFYQMEVDSAIMQYGQHIQYMAPEKPLIENNLSVFMYVQKQVSSL